MFGLITQIIRTSEISYDVPAFPVYYIFFDVSRISKRSKLKQKILLFLCLSYLK